MRFPFTATQWQELEHQALVFKYMVSGMPIPPDLLFPIKTSLDSSLSSNFLLHQPQHIAGWNGFQIGFGKKIDPEPGRCRRTDGKKWRCSKEAFPDSKYCERHMHRGRNRSRKPVEILSPPQQPSSLKSAAAPSESHFLYPHFPSSRESPNFFLEPNLYSKPQSRDCSRRTEGEINEVAFFPAGSDSYSSSVKPKSYSSDLGEKIETFDDSNCRQYQHQHDYRFYSRDAADEQPKKVMHHFLDEWAPNESKSEEKMPSHRTQLSISVPNSLHDFFVTQK